MISSILRKVNFFIPKNKRKICLYSNTFFSGNSQIFRKFLENRKKFKIVYLSDNKEIGTIKAKTMKGIFHFLTSKFIISSHGIPQIKSKNQTSISFWHGIPIKTIGKLYSNKTNNYNKLIDFQITNSVFVNLIFSNVWNLNPNKFVELGEPIYDYFNNPNKFLEKDEKKIVQKYKNLNKKYKKIVLYAPTYRNSRYGRDEGEDINILIDKIVNIAKKNKDKYFLISLHPCEFVKKETFKEISKLKNCSKLEINSEKILPFVHSIILDVSSLYFHSLYLNKEIICFFPDFEKYKKNRGLIFKNLEIFPKEIICFNEKELNNILNNYNHKILFKLEIYRRMFFPKRLDNSCEKIFDELIVKIKNK
jgi:CDP-glycerol glycerophosphotransferase